MASNVSAVSGSVANDHQTLASRFHKPPYDPGQWVFPSPVLTLAFLCGPSRLVAKLKYWHTYTPPTLVYPQTRSYFKGQFTLGTVSETYPKNRQVPRAPLPHAGVTVMGKASRAFSESVTPPSSLLRTHAPDLAPPMALGFPLVTGLCRLLPAPCWDKALPDVISANLSPRAWTSTPAALVVHIPVSSHKTTAFPALGPGRRLAKPIQRLPYGALFRGCNHSLMFRPADLLATPVAPTAMPLGTRQPWLLRPRISRFVTSPSSGYANRPFRATDGKRTLTSQDSQPCRLLPQRQS